MPRSVLLHVCISATDPAAWGDIIFSVGAFVLLVVQGGLIFVAFLVILGSMAFFVGNTEGMTQQVLGALTMFSTYPMNIYS